MADTTPMLTLDRRYFISPDVFSEETEKVFRERWLYVGRAFQAAETGDYFTAEIEDESLIALRGDDGELQVFYNHCRHRGTLLATESAGHCGRHLTCPYHAWSYGHDGRLVGAPHMEETPGFNKADYPLKKPVQRIWEGGVFINFSDTPEPFERAFAPVLEKFAPWHVGELQPAHREEYDVAANWKLICQNYSECYHCPIIHPALEKLSHYRDTENDLEKGAILGGPMRIGAEGGGLSRSGQLSAPPLPGLSGDELQRAYYYVFFPTFFISLQPDFVLTHHLQRVAPDHTRIICEWLYHPDAIAMTDFDPQPTVDLWNEINRQDWAVSELTQRGLASRAHTPGPYSSLESMPAALDREYLKAMNATE